MERRLRLVLLGLALVCGGCPRTPVSKTSSPQTPGAATPLASGSPQGVEKPPTTPVEQALTPSLTPLPPIPEEGLAAEDLPLGTQAHPWPGVNLGLERVEALPRLRGGKRQEERAGHLTLARGQLFFSSDVFAGDQVRCGGALLEVLRVEPSAVRFRWLRSPLGAEPPKVLPARPRLRELGLYRFTDGRVLGVGKVTTLAKRDGSPVEVVTLSLFPPNYEQNPLQDYEVLPRLVVGKPLGEGALAGRQLRLAELKPGQGESPGWIRLAE